MEKERSFTKQELADCDGRKGRPVYVAVKGVVYDLSASKMWKGGEHMDAHDAGMDLSTDLERAPHPASRVEEFPRVGVLAPEGVAKAAPPVLEPGQTVRAIPTRPKPEDPMAGLEPPLLVRLANLIHAHPASVHYPVALMSVASLLQFMDMITGCEVCGLLAFYNLVIGLAFAPIAIFSGAVDWFWYFGGKFRGLYRWKILLSAGLLVLAGFTVYMKLYMGESFEPLYQVLVLAHAPVVFLLGFLGGRIVFHS